MDNHNVGIIGIGRFGLAIANLLSKNNQINLYLNDRFMGKARQAAKILQCSFSSVDELIKQCRIIILCIPGKEVLPLLDKYVSLITSQILIIDHSTDHSSEYITEHLKQNQCYRYIGLRPVSQANAINHNLPITFISENINNDDLTKINLIYKDKAKIISGNELIVKEINEFITYKTLDIFSEVGKYLIQIDMHKKIPIDAIKAIVLGTAEDHPDNNNYITNIMQKYGISFTEK